MYSIQQLHYRVSISHSVTNISDWAAIYNDNDFAKSKRFETFLTHPGVRPLGFLTDNQEARLRRKAITAGLSDRNLRDFEPSLLDQVQLFLKYIIEHQGHSVNLSPACKYFTFDVSSLYVRGKSWNTLTMPAKRVYIKLLAASNHRYYVCLQNPILSTSRFTALMYPRTVMALAIRGFWKKCERTFYKTKKVAGIYLPNSKRNLLSYISSIYEDRQNPFKENMIMAESTFILDAGQFRSLCL